MGYSTLAVGECYREVGLEVAAGFNGTPDHIAAELEFMHFLVVKELDALAGGDPVRAQHVRQKQTSFLERHLGGFQLHLQCRGAGQQGSPDLRRPRGCLRERSTSAGATAVLSAAAHPLDKSFRIREENDHEAFL
jgi:hypothetical protein